MSAIVEWNGARYIANEDAFGVLVIAAGAKPLERAQEARSDGTTQDLQTATKQLPAAADDGRAALDLALDPSGALLKHRTIARRDWQRFIGHEQTSGA